MSIFAALSALVGKRSDDPGVITFHAREGLAPPPDIFVTNQLYPVEHPTAGYSVNYGAELRTLEAFPARRENGRFVAYVTGATFDAAFAEPIVASLTTKSPASEAEKAAKAVKKTGMYEIITVQRANGRVLDFVYQQKTGRPFREVRLRADELEKDDPRLQAMRDAIVQPAPRIVPKEVGPAATADMPDVVKKLAATTLAGESFGDVDLEIYEDFQTGGPGAWTRNPSAENEFRVFGGDGSGGLLAFWLVHDGKPLEEQPIVFLESEGGRGAIAAKLSDFVVLLANGIGPYEVVAYGSTSGETNADVRAIADAMPGTKERTPVQILIDANAAYADIDERLQALTGA